jgi:hypothetical protein
MINTADSKCVNFFNKIVSTRYQALMLLVTSVFILLIIRGYYQSFRILEPSPQLRPITAKKIAEWKGDPTLVKAGLNITNFPEFNVSSNIFTFDGVVWFEFDKALASLETISKFTFEKGDIISKSKAETRALGDRIFAEFVVRVRFSSNLTYDLFPLDEHRIYISMVNSATTPSELIFDAYKPGFVISKDLFISEWRIVDTHVDAGYSEAQLDINDAKKTERHPKIVFSLDILRSGNRQAVLIFLPLFLIFFLSLFALSLDPKEYSISIMAMTSACISSLIGYRFVIQNMSPNIGNFMLGDQVFMLLLAFAFINFLLGLILTIHKDLTPTLRIVRGVVFLSFHIVFLIVWYYLLMYWKG